jgi:hypothetical protein
MEADSVFVDEHALSSGGLIGISNSTVKLAQAGDAVAGIGLLAGCVPSDCWSGFRVIGMGAGLLEDVCEVNRFAAGTGAECLIHAQANRLPQEVH